jgi:hypothetical protein
MNKLGKVIWNECGKKAIDEGALNVIEWICENKLFIGAKTFKRRLIDGQWQVSQLAKIQEWMRSDKIANAINNEFHLLPPTNGMQHDKSR